MRIRPALATGMLLCAAVTASAQTASGPVHMPSTTNTPVAASPDPAPASVWSQPLKLPNPSAAPGTNTAPAAPSTDGDIRDIHGPISIPYAWLWVIWVAVSLLAAAALYFLWRFIACRKKVRAKLPFEIALEKLEAARELMKAEKVREYAFTVSEIIRVYIEQRFGEVSARRTTEEFLSDLVNQSSTPLAAHRDQLEDFLNHCDLIKFARWGASARELESMHESARTFIVETKPQAEAPKPASVETKPQLQDQLAQVK